MWFAAVILAMFLSTAESAVDLRKVEPAKHVNVGKFSALMSERSTSRNVLGELKEEIIFLPTNLGRGFVGEEINFGLIGGVEVSGQIGKITGYNKDSFVWAGPLDGGGNFHLSYSSGSMVGNVYFPDKGYQYEIRPVSTGDGAYVVSQVPYSLTDERDAPESVRSQLEGAADKAMKERVAEREKKGALAVDTNNIIDVMVLYTPAVLAYYQQDADSVYALTILAVEMANEAYVHSEIDMRMRLARFAQVTDTSYVESGFSSDLSRLRIEGDNYFDADTAHKASVGADATVLIVANYQYCGLGYLWSSAATSYSLISLNCPQSLVHEVGHNIGCHHDRATAGSTDYNAYNFGYCWDTSATTCKRSVMAYESCITPNGQSSCPRDTWFSSPLITQGALNQPTGLVTSDNARVTREEISRVINWTPATIAGGLVFDVSPEMTDDNICIDITIDAWRVGTGADIVSVTLDGVEVEEIVSQTMDSVVVHSAYGSGATGTGEVVITTSSGYVTTLDGGFYYTPNGATAGSGCDRTRAPSAEPSAAPTLLPGESWPPTIEPTVQPSAEPSAAPTVMPSATTMPTNEISFPHTTGVLTNTNSARQNTVPVRTQGCGGDVIVFDTCDNPTTTNWLRDTYIRLFDSSGSQVAINDDLSYSNQQLCSRIIYTVPLPAGTCDTYTLQLGCFASSSCEMTATAEWVVNPPSAVPTAAPSRMPSIETTAMPTTGGFDWGTYDDSHVATLRTFRATSNTRVDGAKTCVVMQKPNGKYLKPKEGVVSIVDNVVNGFTKLKVGYQAINKNRDKFNIVFGKQDTPAMAVKWEQKLLENSGVVQIKDLSAVIASNRKNQDIEAYWQLDLSHAFTGSDGVTKTFPAGSDYFIELQVKQYSKRRMCVRLEGLVLE
mmetsp:Transcript_63753/g.132745  ORF Transcript_63753/g.132745 Transcript_63753/m.132745 type:complete len:894 (+) Transcript_63753:122-2803(+)